MAGEFLEIIESIRAEEASVQRLFGSEGRGVRSTRGTNPRYLKGLAEAATFVADVFAGKRPAYQLMEAMGTSDFPLYFGDILDRQVLAAYREAPQTFRNYCKVSQVRDFREVKRYAFNGADNVLEAVGPQAPYPGSKLNEGAYTLSVGKFGRRLPFTWEAKTNDDMDMLSEAPVRLGRAGRRSEEKYATELFVDANGPHASLYTAGNKNIITGNPVFDIVGLQKGLLQLASQVDEGGEPIVIDAVELVVPPALMIPAQNVLNATMLEISGEAGGTSGQKLMVANWMRNKLRLSVNPYIPIVAKTANTNTSWFLFASPDNGRPALEMAFLRGHVEPELFVKEPNARRVGGGGVNPLDGDFDTDSIDYKVRHVFGGARIDPKMSVASNGSGQT